jgi:hypothetical protein
MGGCKACRQRYTYIAVGTLARGSNTSSQEYWLSQSRTVPNAVPDLKICSDIVVGHPRDQDMTCSLDSVLPSMGDEAMSCGSMGDMANSSAWNWKPEPVQRER